MNDFNFEEDFKAALDRERQFEVQDSDWNNLSTRLERKAAQCRRRWQWAVRASLFALLLLTSLGWWKAQRDIAVLENQIMAQNNQTALQTLNSTAQQVAANQTDTIYTALNQGQIASPLTSSPKTGPNHLNSTSRTATKADASIAEPKNILEKTPESGTNAEPPNKPQPELGPIPTTNNTTATANGANAPMANKAGIALLPSPVLRPLQGKSSKTPLDSAQYAINRVANPNAATDWVARLILCFRPHELGIGAGGGGLLQQAQWHGMAQGNTFGLQAQKAFGKRLRLTAEVRLATSNTHFGTDAPFGSGLPYEPPPAAGFTLAEVLIKQQLQQLALGFRWQMRTEKRWQPYIGAGIFGTFGSSGQVKYKFTAASTSTGVTVERVLLHRYLLEEGGQILLGSDWRFGPYSVGAEAILIPTFEGHNHTGQGFGLRGHVFYFF